MPSDASENNPIVVALRDFFRPMLRVTEKLPAPLAYSLLAVIAIIVLVILGAVIPIELVVLLGVVLLAGLAAFVFIDWDNRRQTKLQIIDSPPSVTSDELRIPASGKLGILVDLSHQQDKWTSKSIFDLPSGRSNLISLVVPPSSDLPWDVQEINDTSKFQVNDLGNWRGLIFGMPYHQLIDQEILQAIREWVIQGGRLVLLGYELGERHHRTNLNLLSDRFFGLRFNSDIVAPENWRSSRAKPYGEEIVFHDVNSKKHPILKGVKSLCMRNICTLTVEPGSLVVLTVGNNRVSREMSPNYTNGWTSSGVQQFEVMTDADWLPVIAEAPRGLCGKGKVIAIGTWDFYGTDECFRNSDNDTFVKNLLEWSVDRGQE